MMTNSLDSKKVPYPCGFEKCGHNPDFCCRGLSGGRSGCLQWSNWFSAKWAEVTEELRGTEKKKSKVITQKEKFNALFGSHKCPVAFASKETQKKTVEWLLSCGVMIPPCQIGDMLWFVGEDGVEFDVVEKIQFVHTGLQMPRVSAEGWIVFGKKTRFHDWEFGSAVFLKRTEADVLAKKILKVNKK